MNINPGDTGTMNMLCSYYEKMIKYYKMSIVLDDTNDMIILGLYYKKIRFMNK